MERLILSTTVHQARSRVRELIESSVFNPAIDKHNVFFWSAIIEILIHLRHLCRIADDYGCHLGWKDNLVSWTTCRDITKKIEFFRDGLCHSHTFHRIMVKQGVTAQALVRGVIVGKQSTTILGTCISCQYDDDALILLGKESVYLKRHIFRAFHELDEILTNKDPLQRIFARSPPPPPKLPPRQNTTE